MATGQKHWLSVPLCLRYSNTQTLITPRVPAATCRVQTGPLRADRARKAQASFSGLYHCVLPAKNVCGKHVALSVTGWWTGINL